MTTTRSAAVLSSCAAHVSLNEGSAMAMANRIATARHTATGLEGKPQQRIKIKPVPSNNSGLQWHWMDGIEEEISTLRHNRRRNLQHRRPLFAKPSVTEP